jgi:hypothetical protein
MVKALGYKPEGRGFETWGSKMRLVRGADNLTAIYELIV